jgi:hypothetical protein
MMSGEGYIGDRTVLDISTALEEEGGLTIKEKTFDW